MINSISPDVIAQCTDMQGFEEVPGSGAKMFTIKPALHPQWRPIATYRRYAHFQLNVCDSRLWLVNAKSKGISLIVPTTC